MGALDLGAILGLKIILLVIAGDHGSESGGRLSSFSITDALLHEMEDEMHMSCCSTSAQWTEYPRQH